MGLSEPDSPEAKPESPPNTTTPPKSTSPTRAFGEVEQPEKVEHDFTDPQQRFQLLSLARVLDKSRAIVLDRMTREEEMVEEGSTLGDYRVMRIDSTKRSVYLRGKRLESVVLKMKRRSN